MSRRSTKQRRAARRRHRWYAVHRWVQACTAILQSTLCTPSQPWFKLTLRASHTDLERRRSA
jgi:hypothetical protein